MFEEISHERDAALAEVLSKPDEMMKELRSARQAIQRQVAGMTREEKTTWFHEQSRQFATKHGYELVPCEDHPRAHRLIRRSENAPS